MSLSHPGGLSTRTLRKTRGEAWGQLLNLLTSPVGLGMVLILAFNLSMIVLFWRDGKFNWLFEARGAVVDTSSKSWMGSAGRGARPSEYRGSSGVDDRELRRSVDAAKAAAALASEAEPSDDEGVGLE